MTLTNGYKLVYEVINTVDGTRTFKASKERYPTQDDVTILEREISNEFIYEYKGNFYVANGNIPSYDEDGVPTDTCISDNENFREVFGLGSEAATTAMEDELTDPEVDVTETDDPETGDQTEAE